MVECILDPISRDARNIGKQNKHASLEATPNLKLPNDQWSLTMSLFKIFLDDMLPEEEKYFEKSRKNTPSKYSFKNTL